MTDSTPTPDLHGWFKAHRRELADDGFTASVMRRLPPGAPLPPPLAAAASVAALFICLAAANRVSVVDGVLRFAAAAANSVSAATLWLNAAIGNALHNPAALHDLLPTLAVGVGVLYLVAVAGLAILASTLKLRIY